MAVSRQQRGSYVLSGGVIAIALLLTKNVLLLLLLLIAGMLIAAVTFTIISAKRQKALNANLEQQVEARTLQLQASMAELEELSSLQDLLLYAISHDLRTTVMGCLMVLENLQGQAGDMIPVSRELLQRMTQSSKTQLDHLNQLLEAYGNITDGIQLKKSRVSISAVLQEAIANLSPLLQENNITLTNLVSVDSFWVMADVEKIRQVFHHLISNAVNHNPPGIEIRIEAIVENPTVRFTITDTGIGIDLPEQKDLFELCLKPPQERQFTRISLGLYLCKQIVTAHGGQIAVQSQVGEGTKIGFTLPIDA
jgi:signal transduction histidine kinase